MKTGHYFFVVGIVGAIIAGGYSLGQVVDISSFEVLPEANADGIEGTTGDYFKYASSRISAGYSKWISILCDTGDKSTGFMDYHKPTTVSYRASPYFIWDSTLGVYYAGGMHVQFHNTSTSSDWVYLVVFCTAR